MESGVSQMSRMNKQKKQALGVLGYIALFLAGFVFHEQILGMFG